MGEDDKIDHSYANGVDANPMLRDLMAEIRSVNETVKDIKITVADTKADMSKISDRMTRTENIAEDASKLVVEVRNDLTKEINSLREQLITLKVSSEMPGNTTALKEMRSQLEKQEAYSRRYNLVIDGIEEGKGETAKALRQKVDSFFINILGVSSVRFDIAHRLGPVCGTRSRRVIMKFRCLTDKNIIWEARDKLKTKANSGYKLLLDCPTAAKEREALAFRIVYTANKSPNFNNAKFQSGKIHIDGVAFDYEDLENLPEELSPCNVYTPRNNSVVVFFTKHSILSNHHKIMYTVDGVLYTSIEQYLARSQAILAQNSLLTKKALLSDNPVELKKYLHWMKEDGKEEEWRKDINTWLYPALEAKFSQNHIARSYLLETKDLSIGEASTDNFWGVGLNLSDDKIFQESYWSGKNVLGKALMEIRKRICAAEH